MHDFVPPVHVGRTQSQIVVPQSGRKLHLPPVVSVEFVQTPGESQAHPTLPSRPIHEPSAFWSSGESLLVSFVPSESEASVGFEVVQPMRAPFTAPHITAVRGKA